MSLFTFKSDPPSLLIVDDDPAALYVKSQLFGRQGCRILEANNGAQALTIAAAELPDLVVLDVNLPDINGFEVCERLKTQPETKHIKVLQTSAVRIGGPDRVKSLEVGADAYLVEPAEEEELLGTVRALLRLAQQERDNRRLIEKLSHIERRLLDATEAADCGMWDWDILTGKLEWFGAHERLAGMRPGGFSGKIEAFINILHPDDRARVWQKLDDLMARHETHYTDEYRFVHPNGTVRWMSGTGRLFYDETGKAVRMTGVVQDITERKRAEEALSDSEVRFRIFFDNAAVGAGQINRAKRFIYVNDRYCRITGYSREELLGKMSPLDLDHPDDNEADRARIADLFHGSKTHLMYEKRYLHKKGHVVWVRITVAPIRDEQGVVQTLAAIVEDITERHEAESALHEAQKRLQATLAAAEIGTWYWDLTDNRLTTDENLKRLFGVEGTDEVPVEVYTQRIHSDDFAENQAAIERVVRDGGSYDQQFRVVRSDGTVRWLHSRGKVEAGEGGERSFVGVVLDVTERKQAEEALGVRTAELESLMTSAPLGVTFFDRQHRYVRINEALASINGIPAADHIGRTLAELLPVNARTVDPIIDQVFATGKTVGNFEVSGETPLEPGVLRHWLTGFYPVRNPQGEVELVGAWVVEITERKRAEDALGVSETRFRTLASAVPVGIFRTDASGRCVYVNEWWQRMAGMEAEQAYGSGWTERLHSDDRGKVFETWMAAVEHHRPFAAEYRFVKPSGETTWVLGHAVPEPEGGYVGITMDITERKQTEERLRLALEGADMGSWDVDLRTRRAMWDRRHALMQGYETEDQPHMMTQWWDRIHPDDLQRVQAVIDQAKQSRASFTVDHRVCLPQNHKVRWLSLYGRFTYDDRGEPVRISGVSLDITERKQAEESLRESEERLSSILNRAQAAIFIKDPAGRYLFMNEQCARVLSVNREQASGHTDRDLLSPELAAQFMANDQRVWESGKLLTVEEQVPHADGVHISLVQKFLLRDGHGRPYALSGIALDITPHLQLEAAIQASEARLQLAQSAANIGVFDWDIAAQKGVWSPELERIWGLPVGGFDGTVEAWRRLVHPDDRTSAEAGFLRSLEDPTTASEYEYRIVRQDGAVRWIYAKARTLRDADGQAVRMVGVNLDITDRKEAQLRLERFAEELERQVASRTQELVRSQDRLRALATELNLTEQRERKRLATELHDHLQQLLVLGKLTIGQGKRAAAGVPACEQVFKKVDEIFSDALTYTRTLVSDLSPPVLRDHGLAAALQWLGTYMQKHGQTVRVTVADDREFTLPEDQRVLLFQSVRELLINSAKHAGTGQAALTMEQRDGNVYITVKDEGQGFDPAASTAGIPSSGISSKYGLYSIQERMRAIDGSLTIDSAPGQGTTASLVVPLTRTAKDSVIPPEFSRAKPARAALSADTSGGHKKGVNIVQLLLVDDHSLVRQGLRSVLDSYEDIQIVGEAQDGMEAVKLVEELRPRVVVMDINMPKMNGIEATAKIKQRHPEIIVIGLSVNATEDNLEAMIRAGASRLLSKEVAVEQLHDAVYDALSERDKGRTSTMKKAE